MLSNITTNSELGLEYLRPVKDQTYQFCVPYGPLECDSIKYDTFSSFIKIDTNNSLDLASFVVYFSSLD